VLSRCWSHPVACVATVKQGCYFPFRKGLACLNLPPLRETLSDDTQPLNKSSLSHLLFLLLQSPKQSYSLLNTDNGVVTGLQCLSFSAYCALIFPLGRHLAGSHSHALRVRFITVAVFSLFAAFDLKKRATQSWETIRLPRAVWSAPFVDSSLPKINRRNTTCYWYVSAVFALVAQPYLSARNQQLLTQFAAHGDRPSRG